MSAKFYDLKFRQLSLGSCLVVFHNWQRIISMMQCMPLLLCVSARLFFKSASLLPLRREKKNHPPCLRWFNITMQLCSWETDTFCLPETAHTASLLQTRSANNYAEAIKYRRTKILSETKSLANTISWTLQFPQEMVRDIYFKKTQNHIVWYFTDLSSHHLASCYPQHNLTSLFTLYFTRIKSVTFYSEHVQILSVSNSSIVQFLVYTGIRSSFTHSGRFKRCEDFLKIFFYGRLLHSSTFLTQSKD